MDIVRDMDQCTNECRALVDGQMDNQKFDAAALLTYNSVTNTLTRFNAFVRHPEEWTAKDIAAYSRAMAEAAAKGWAEDEQNPANEKRHIGPLKKIVLVGPQYSDYINLIQVGVLPPRRLYFTIFISKEEFGLCTRKYVSTDARSGKRFWSWGLLIGFFVFRIMRDLNE